MKEVVRRMYHALKKGELDDPRQVALGISAFISLTIFLIILYGLN